MTAQQAINEIVRRIVLRFNPEKIILFGSHARGDALPDSDIDLIVVLSKIEGTKRRKRLEIRGELHGLGVSKDVLVRTPEEMESERDIVGTIGRIAAQEGRLLYERSH